MKFGDASKNRVKYNFHLSLFVILGVQRKLGIRNRGHIDIHVGAMNVCVSDLVEYMTRNSAYSLAIASKAAAIESFGVCIWFCNWSGCNVGYGK